MRYWNLVFWSAVDLLVQLLGKRTEDEAKFVETELFRLTGVKVYHVVVLDPSNACEICQILGVNVTFIADIQQLVEVDEVEVLAFSEVLS